MWLMPSLTACSSRVCVDVHLHSFSCVTLSKGPVISFVNFMTPCESPATWTTKKIMKWVKLFYDLVGTSLIPVELWGLHIYNHNVESAVTLLSLPCEWYFLHTQTRVTELLIFINPEIYFLRIVLYHTKAVRREKKKKSSDQRVHLSESPSEDLGNECWRQEYSW